MLVSATSKHGLIVHCSAMSPGRGAASTDSEGRKGRNRQSEECTNINTGAERVQTTRHETRLVPLAVALAGAWTLLCRLRLA